MVAVRLLGREFEIAPYTLGELRRIAPALDRIRALEQGTTGASIATACGLAAVVAVGLGRIDPSLTPAVLLDRLDLGDLPALEAACSQIIAASGIGTGRSSSSFASRPISLDQQLRELIAYLLAAGMEAGCRQALDGWTMADVDDMHEHWRSCGPPTHIAVAVFASAWGCKLTSDRPAAQVNDEAEIMQLIAATPMT